MADQSQQNTGSNESGQTTTANANENMIPHSRFNEVNTELKEARAKIAEFEAAQAQSAEAAKQANEKRLAEQQKWQELAESRAAELEQMGQYKTRWDAMVEKTAERNKSRFEAIPESMRSLVPDYEDPMKLASWLDANMQTLTTKPSAPSLNGGAGGGSRNGSQTTKTWQEIQQEAGALNVSPHLLAQSYGVSIPANL